MDSGSKCSQSKVGNQSKIQFLDSSIKYSNLDQFKGLIFRELSFRELTTSRINVILL